MEKIKLIYFNGCPNVTKAKDALKEAGVCEFEEVCQDDLSPHHVDRNYSSPTILSGDTIIVGGTTQGEGGCTVELISAEGIKRKLAEHLKVTKSWFTRIGAVGSAVVVGLCPICIPAIGAFLASIGLGFLVSETVLKPLLFVFLILVLVGLLWSSVKEHRKWSPFILGCGVALAIYLGRYVYIALTVNKILMYGGILGLFAVTLWNLRIRKRHGCKVCAPKHS